MAEVQNQRSDLPGAGSTRHVDFCSAWNSFAVITSVCAPAPAHAPRAKAVAQKTEDGKKGLSQTALNSSVVSIPKESREGRIFKKLSPDSLQREPFSRNQALNNGSSEVTERYQRKRVGTVGPLIGGRLSGDVADGLFLKAW